MVEEQGMVKWVLVVEQVVVEQGAGVVNLVLVVEQE